MNLDQFADALRKAASDIKDHGALRACEEACDLFKDKLQENTPVESGALRDSESVDSVTGDGESARGRISTHLPLYAYFREHGGVIRAHDRPRGGWTGEPTGVYPRRWGIHQHTLHWEGGPFPLQVTQVGSFYMDRTVAWANGGAIADSAKKTVNDMLRESGL